MYSEPARVRAQWCVAHDAVLLVLTLEHVQDAHARLEAARGAGQWHPAPPPALAC
jgi:hypothetical protein